MIIHSSDMMGSPALAPGVHSIDTLMLTDIQSGVTMNLRYVVRCVTIRTGLLNTFGLLRSVIDIIVHTIPFTLWCSSTHCTERKDVVKSRGYDVEVQQCANATINKIYVSERSKLSAVQLPRLKAFLISAQRGA